MILHVGLSLVFCHWSLKLRFVPRPKSMYVCLPSVGIEDVTDRRGVLPVNFLLSF